MSDSIFVKDFNNKLIESKHYTYSKIDKDEYINILIRFIMTTLKR